jgi:DNA-binding SARP family transcriptional activator
MQIALLGPLEVRADSGTPVDVVGRRLRTLLIVLALEPGRVVTQGRLIDAVWGDEPEHLRGANGGAASRR